MSEHIPHSIQKLRLHDVNDSAAIRSRTTKLICDSSNAEQRGSHTEIQGGRTRRPSRPNSCFGIGGYSPNEVVH